MKALNTRDALLALRTVVAEDAEKAEETLILLARLNSAIDARAEAVASALTTLEGYIGLHTQMHGFDPELEGLAVSTSASSVSDVGVPTKKATKKRRSAKKKTTKKQSMSAVAARPAKAKGYPSQLDQSIKLSEVEQEFVDVLLARWPRFTTPKFLMRAGILPAANHVTAKVNQLRKKGVPIESARQARQADGRVSPKARGYRLIG